MSAGPPPAKPLHPHPYVHVFRHAFDALGWESHRAHELAIFRTFAVP